MMENHNDLDMPTILTNHFSDVLDNGAGEFEDAEEVYEAIGEVLEGISEKSEEDVKSVTFFVPRHTYTSGCCGAWLYLTALFLTDKYAKNY